MGACDPSLAQEHSPVASKIMAHIERLWFQDGLVQMLAVKDLTEQTTALRKVLSSLAVDSTGRVPCSELKSYAQGNPDAQELIERILQKVDPLTSDKGLLEWGELFDAAIDWKRRQPEELRSKVRNIFDGLRMKNDGTVVISEFKKSFPMAKSEDERILDDLFNRIDEKRKREIYADDLEVFFSPWKALKSESPKAKKKIVPVE